MSLRHVAPAGAPIGAWNLARWAGTLASRRDPRAAFVSEFETRLGVRHATLTCTGRAGLTVLLRALRRLGAADADEVIVPAYTCYSVPASIVRAGLRPRLVDIDPVTLDYDRAALDGAETARVLAIVATNLYGLPNDLPALVEFGRARGVLVIDDAAQAMGAVSSGRPAGTWGDAGLYSLDKGKNVSAIDGGVLVTNVDRVREALAAETAALADPSALRRVEHIVKALVYATLLHPRVYWIPNAIPQLGLGRTVYTTEFAIEAEDPSLAALASVMLRHLDRFTEVRRANAARLAEAIGAQRGLTIPLEPAGSKAAWLRLPVLVDDPERRAHLMAALNAAGIGATGSYPASLADVPELQPSLAAPAVHMPGARLVASRILTLPTHPYVSSADIRTIARVMASAGPAHRLSAAAGAATR
jgi:dTDP-4-amino-4,6-dideoxygalactose transaminase